MKNKKILLLGLASAFMMFSCEPEDDGTGYSLFDNVTPANASVEFGEVSGLTVNESDVNTGSEDGYYIPITVTIDEALPVDTRYTVTVNEGTTGTKDADFSIPNRILIPAGSLQGTGYFVINSDCELEDTETISITVGKNNLGNYNITPTSYTVNVENYQTDQIAVVFDWAGQYVDQVDGNEIVLDYCDIADFDLLVFDELDTNMEINDAATSNCPEELVLSGDSLPDGNYTLRVDNYEYVNTFETDFGEYEITESFNFPIMFTAEGCGTGFSSSADYGELFTNQEALHANKVVASFSVVNGEIQNFEFGL